METAERVAKEQVKREPEEAKKIKDAEYSEVWSDKGTALVKLGRNEEALEILVKAIELDPTNFKAWHNKAIALRRLGRDKEARKAEELEKLAKKEAERADKERTKKEHGETRITKDAESADAWRDKGTALVKLGKSEEAFEAFMKAIELDPKYASSPRNKVTAPVRFDRYKEAGKAQNTLNPAKNEAKRAAQEQVQKEAGESQVSERCRYTYPLH